MIFTNKHKNVIRIYIVLLAIFLLIMSGGLGVALAINKNNIFYENFITEKPALPSVILDINGDVISELVGVEQRYILNFNELPKSQIFALLTREDHPFFYHSGFSVLGFSRAMFRIITTGTLDHGGGSTLTQQLAKIRLENTFNRNVFNKIIELWETWQMERQYSKQEIMEIYLNEVNFGHGAYGVEAISQYFFDHSARENSVAESALVSIQMARPTLYSPDRNPSGARKIQKQVLDQMVGHGYVSKEEAELSFAKYWNSYDWSRVSSNTVHTNRTRDDRAPWFTEYVREEIKNHLYGTQDAYKDGYIIYTTLDLSFQEAADKYVTEQLDNARKVTQSADEKKREAVYNQFAHVISTIALLSGNESLRIEEKAELRRQKEYFQNKVVPDLRILSLLTGNNAINKIATESEKLGIDKTANPVEVALLTVENSTGQIRAIIGGSQFEYNKNRYNRALQASVSPGSSLKPLFISAGISSNQVTPGTHFIDGPKTFYAEGNEPYTPNNYGGKWRGDILLRDALALSLNIPAIEVLQATGFDSAIERIAALLGITDRAEIRKNFPRNYPLALGTSAVSPAQMTRAYTAFANGGRSSELYGIRYIEDQRGRIIAHIEDEMLQKSYAPQNQVMSQQDAYIMADMMKSAFDPGGTFNYGFRMAGGFNGMAMAGKTGTSQNWRDAWAIGFSPYYTTSVWFGFDEGGKTLGQDFSGAVLPGPVWTKYMRDIHLDLPIKTFDRPRGIVERTISTISGNLATQNTPQANTRREVFKEGTEPTTLDTYHVSKVEDKQTAVSKILNDLLIESEDYNLIKPDELQLDFLDEKQDIFKDDELDLGSAFWD